MNLQHHFHHNKYFPRLKPESELLLNTDALRFIAAFSIVFLHFKDSLVLPKRIDWIFNRLDNCTLFVDLFFVISGFVMAFVYINRISSFRDYYVYIARRVARLVPLHWAVLFAYVALGIIGQHFARTAFDRDKYDLHCFVPHFFLLNSSGLCSKKAYNSASWSIGAEMSMYLVFPVLMALVRRWPGVTFTGVVMLLLVLFCSPFDVSVEPSWLDWTYEAGTMRALPSFLMGIVFYHYRANFLFVPRPDFIMVFFLVSFFVLTIYGVPKGLLLPLIYLIVLMSIISDERKNVLPLVNKLAALGQLTYSAYMIHLLIRTVFITLIGYKVLHLRGGLINGFVILMIPIVFMFSYISLVWFETPARRLITKFLIGSEAKTVAESVSAP